MHKIYTLLFTIFFLYLTGCEDKKTSDSSISLENTTAIFTSKDKEVQQKKQEHIEAQKKFQRDIATLGGDTFTLVDTNDTALKLTLIKKNITFHTIDKPIVVINFFSLTCSSCLDQMASLSKLQKKHQEKLSVISVLRGDSQGNSTFKNIIQKHHISHFISHSKDDESFSKKLYASLHINENDPLPLTIIYKEGKYYSHFEGPVPIEMIHHDIQNSIKK